MSFTVPRFPSLPFHRSVIEHWTYRWDQEQQRYTRATYRPLSVDEPPDNPREEIDQDPPAVAGLPQEESSTSQTPPRFSGSRFPNPDFVVPLIPMPRLGRDTIWIERFQLQFPGHQQEPQEPSGGAGPGREPAEAWTARRYHPAPDGSVPAGPPRPYQTAPPAPTPLRHRARGRRRPFFLFLRHHHRHCQNASGQLLTARCNYTHSREIRSSSAFIRPPASTCLPDP